MLFTTRKVGSLEFFVSVGIIFILVFIALIYLEGVVVKAKEMVLVSELRNIRIALNLYHGFNNRYPDNLKDLVGKDIDWTKITHEIYKRNYLEHQRVDKNSNPIDPWGRLFSYEPFTGKLNCRTKGYDRF
ncbi:MAG: type II secretion system protein GspG [Candidatus Omnitrophica bacterium]|nr:type II secretion system protein GspG [Candidatus Omnitrophota bacterium]